MLICDPKIRLFICFKTVISAFNEECLIFSSISRSPYQIAHVETVFSKGKSGEYHQLDSYFKCYNSLANSLVSLSPSKSNLFSKASIQSARSSLIFLEEAMLRIIFYFLLQKLCIYTKKLTYKH